jgi:hypothetical protein
MKTKLLAILGSGSSIPLGLPSVNDLDRLMAGWARESAAARGEPDYFGELRTAIEQYQAPEFNRWYPPVTFERVLGNMLALAHWVTPAPTGDPLRAAIGDAFALAPFPHARAHGPTLTLREQMSHLVRRLAAELRERTRTLDRLSDPFARYKRVFDQLRDHFDVAVFNLNYDGAAVNVMPGAFTGFDPSGEFDAPAVHLRSAFDFLYHLHGSVHFSLRQEGQWRIHWRDDLTGGFTDDDGAVGPIIGPEGRLLPVATCVAGGFKLDQLLAEPFHSFHAALVRHLYHADAILIAGYGFGDTHVNRALMNRLLVRPRPPVLIVDRREANALMSPNEPWQTGVCQTLLADGSFFSRAPSDDLEIDTVHGVALWRHGFVEWSGESRPSENWLRQSPVA